MKKISAILGSLAIIGSGLMLQPAAHAITIFSASLDSSQEVPPNASTATGTARLILNDAMDELSYFIQLFGLDLDGMQTPDMNDNVTRAHIHRAPAGVNGPIIFGFIDPNNDVNPPDLTIDPVAGTISGIWNAPEGNGTTLGAELPNLFNGGLYVNIHTMQFGGGEIRGQIQQVPAPPTALALLAGLALMGLRPFRQ